MTTFHEAIKEILSEVEKFFVETIKKEKLSKSASDHKQSILDKIFKIREEYPALSKADKEETKSKPDLDKSFSDESSRTGGSNYDDNDEYADSNIPVIAASDIKYPLIEGFLEKKQKRGTLFGAPRLQKRWCAIKASTMYYYESQKEKKQHGAFYLNGYSFELAPDVVDKKDASKKDLSFQLVSVGKRTYQFVALNKDDLDKWKEAIQKAACVEVGGEDEADDVYEPVEEDTTEVPEPIEEDIYEACGDEVDPGGEVYDDATSAPANQVEDEPDEVYDDCANTNTTNTSNSTSKSLPPPPIPPAKSLPPTPPAKGGPPTPPAKGVPGRRAVPPPPTQGLPDLPDLPSAPPPIPPGRHLPDLPLPPVPGKKEEKKPIIHPDQDYENKYYGKYDCQADEGHELSFKKGDMILIISKRFDDKDWWVGKLQDQYGLVPKNYLMPAFEAKTPA
ncbi:hypothetical protein FSP39_018421 [Pinctada imbricata]|uniref:Src kinase-associated phosphoprotein 2 n=1 Tax=Pinctada imbricata TaxID=66713 RepID=A0AA88XS08_PINIB|nr:hypothetical protein FSP39_018421 [Pinctada imbricata]